MAFSTATSHTLVGRRWKRRRPTTLPKELCFLVYGTFAATEDDYENDRGCKDMLKVVKYKELYDNLGDEDRSTLHKYAREKSESLRVSLKRAREPTLLQPVTSEE